MYNSVFSCCFADIVKVWYALPYASLFILIMLFSFATLFCITRSLQLDLADKQDILADKYNNPYSFYDGTYELPRLNIARAMCYANLSYHTFWNAVIMHRFRWCEHKCPQIYFRVNRFRAYSFPFMPSHIVMFLSLAFIWGYIIFLIIILIRLCFYGKALF